MDKPNEILTSLPIELGGNTISLKVEVVDASLDYNLLLGHTWFYAMKELAPSLFQVIHFPHQGKIITIDQINYYTPDLCTDHNKNVPLVSDSSTVTECVGEGIFKDPFFMGVFPMSAPTTTNKKTY